MLGFGWCRRKHDGLAMALVSGFAAGNIKSQRDLKELLRDGQLRKIRSSDDNSTTVSFVNTPFEYVMNGISYQ